MEIASTTMSALLRKLVPPIAPVPAPLLPTITATIRMQHLFVAMDVPIEIHALLKRLA
jgi:hypothetical protein